MTGRASIAQSSTRAVPARQSWQVAETLGKSFRYASTGVLYAVVTQRNFRIHLIVGSVALALGVYVHISGLQMAVIGLTVGLVLALELLNTAVEATVDLVVGDTYHPLAAVAKDCAAGAVLIAACGSLFVAGCILLPALVRWSL